MRYVVAALRICGTYHCLRASVGAFGRGLACGSHDAKLSRPTPMSGRRLRPLAVLFPTLAWHNLILRIASALQVMLETEVRPEQCYEPATYLQLKALKARVDPLGLLRAL